MVEMPSNKTKPSHKYLKEDLAVNKEQWLIYHQTKANLIIYIYIYIVYHKSEYTPHISADI